MKRRTLLSQMVVLSGSSRLLKAKESRSLDPSRLNLAAAYSANQCGKSLLVIQHGKVLYEAYTNGFHAKDGNKIYSGTKAFWNFAALQAEDDGLLRLNEKAASTLPEWQNDSLKSRITIRQLLDFTSGLEPTFDLHEDGILDRDALAIKRPVVAAPGSAFIYGPCSLQVFHEILKRKLAKNRETPTHYLERRVLAPIGLGPQRYVADKSGNPLLAAGFVMTAQMWARFGKMLLGSKSLDEFKSGTDANGAFDLGLWNNHNADHHGAREVDVELMLHEKWPKQTWSRACLCASAPSDLLASIGSGTQRLYMVPSQGLVIVRLGMSSSFSDAQFLRLLFGS